MSEQLSFDGFVAKILEVFEGLPDHRKFCPNLRYSSLLNDGSIPEPSPRTMKDAALGAFAIFLVSCLPFGLPAGNAASTKAKQCAKFIWHRANPGGLINRKLGEPRVHFALNCSALGYPIPPLRLSHPLHDSPIAANIPPEGPPDKSRATNPDSLFALYSHACQSFRGNVL